MRSMQGFQIPVHTVLSPLGSVASILLVSGLFMGNEAMQWRQLQVDGTCGAAAGLWEALLYIRLNFDAIELALAFMQFLKGQHVKLERVVVFILGASLKAVLTMLLLQWAVAWAPRDAELSAKYCDWRAESACWQTPNTTLETYELLFPVTQATLFRRELSQPFRPLETRYEVSVLWNAMTRCRDFSSQDEKRSLPSIYETLPTDPSVDAWCGATYLSRGQNSRGQNGKLLVSYDAVTSPAEAYGEAVATTCGEIQKKLTGFVVIHWALAVLLVVGSHFWPTTQRPKTQRSATQETNTTSIVGETSLGDSEIRDGAWPSDAMGPSPKVDPSWVEV